MFVFLVFFFFHMTFCNMNLVKSWTSKSKHLANYLYAAIISIFIYLYIAIIYPGIFIVISYGTNARLCVAKKRIKTGMCW